MVLFSHNGSFVLFHIFPKGNYKKNSFFSCPATKGVSGKGLTIKLFSYKLINMDLLVQNFWDFFWQNLFLAILRLKKKSSDGH